MLRPTTYPPLPDGFAWSNPTYGQIDLTAAIVQSTGDAAGIWLARISERVDGTGFTVLLGMHRPDNGRTLLATATEAAAARFVTRWVELRQEQIRRELRELERSKWQTPWRAFLRGEPPPPL